MILWRSIASSGPPRPDWTHKDLAIGQRASRQLSARGIVRLADFASLTQHEAQSVLGFGPAMFARVRSSLLALGMDFRPPADPLLRAMQRNRDRLANGGIDPAPGAPLEDIGMDPELFELLWRAEVRCLKDLGNWTAPDLARVMPRRHRGKLFKVLQQAGVHLAGKPDTATLWRHGIVSSKGLEMKVGRQTPVVDLCPFVPQHIAARLRAAGIATLGDAIDALPELRGGRRRIQGVGPAFLQQFQRLVMTLHDGSGTLRWTRARRSTTVVTTDIDWVLRRPLVK